MKSKLFIAFFAAILFFVVFSFSGQTQVLTQNHSQSATKLPFQNLMFSDVESSHENFDAVYFLYNTGVIEGYAQGDTKKRDYKPDNTINRAEFLKLFLEGTGKASNASYEKCFPDVDPKEWYSTYICQAKEKGWVNGYQDGTFKPAQLINEAESLKILGEILDWTLPKPNEKDDWYKPYLSVASSRKIVPEDDISSMMTRGDIAEM
ncbi:MAG: S-layer homology domain-containing protein, partial [Patescibacteria group bacterium]